MTSAFQQSNSRKKLRANESRTQDATRSGLANWDSRRPQELDKVSGYPILVLHYGLQGETATNFV